MKFFLDTANLEEIRRAEAWGVIDGVTTNPTLIAKEGVPQREQIQRICEIVDGPVNAQVLTSDYEGMVKEGHMLAELHRHVVVKVPMTRDGIQACSSLSAEGVRVNVTLCFTPGQALMAAKAGAWCVSGFVGRLDDLSLEGMQLISNTVTIFNRYGLKTLVLAASLRSPRRVVMAAEVGAHIASMPFRVLDQLFNHPLTESGLSKFLKDYNEVFEEGPAGR